MLRLSKLTDYATVILAYLAKNKLHLHAALEISEATGIAQPTVSKVLKMLVKDGVIKSTRGAKGGYALARSPDAISIASVISALEGPIALTECSLSQQNCQQVQGCEIHGNWGLINSTIRKALESITLADMVLPVKTKPVEVNVPVSSLYR